MKIIVLYRKKFRFLKKECKFNQYFLAKIYLIVESTFNLLHAMFKLNLFLMKVYFFLYMKNKKNVKLFHQ